MPTHRDKRKGKRQRFYARNTLNTTFARRPLTVAFGRLMRSFSAAPANFHYTARIHPALLGFAGDVCGFLAPLSAYLMTLALLAIGAWEHLLDATATEPSDKGGWSLADRSARAFAVSQFDLHDKTETYEVFRHPGGGRKDLLRWRDADRKPVAELEIYRPGGEFTQPSLAIADIAGRMDPGRHA